MVIMKDRPKKKNKSKNLNLQEVSGLLRNFYQPAEASIQNFDDFYSELRNKLDTRPIDIETTSRRNQIKEDYQKREKQLEKMLADMEAHRRKVKAPKTHRRAWLVYACILILVCVLAYTAIS